MNSCCTAVNSYLLLMNFAVHNGYLEAAPITVRLAREDDVPVIYRMLRAAAAEQGNENALCVDPDNLLEDGFRTVPPKYQCLIGGLGGHPAGIALYFFTYSTWKSRQWLYLEDLYVDPAFRNKKVARSLMAELARVAIDAGCNHVRWLVLRQNSIAIKFYESIGAKLQPDWCGMSLAGERLNALAGSIRD
jgi:GNAT superfamily N-acetyltransferase